ncbi:MAG: acyl-CoA thioesterase [Gemmatimonadales bacterium]|nr:acyl-CoA thioesterase [Gemmatimonadales bacterium]
MHSRRATTLRFLAEPTHANYAGNVHGGQMMKWIDHVGYACATAWSGKYCVTIYVGGIHFMRPIRVGWIVEMRAEVIHTGSTSMHIMVDIHAGDPREQTSERCGHCVIVFVALDDDRKPVKVPSWTPDTEYDRALQGYALRLMELRKAMEEEMEKSLHLKPDPTVAG